MPPGSPDQRDVEQYAAAVLDGWPLTEIPPEYHNPIVKRLHRLQSDSLSNGEYRRAQQIANKLQTMSFIHSDQSFSTAATTRLENAQTRVNVRKSVLDQTKATNDWVVSQFQSEAEGALANLDAVHQAELEQFDRDHDCEAPERFRKFTREYLQLRAIESFMVSSKRYTEADSVRAKANVMEQKEREVQEQNWKNYVQKQREMLVERQANARRCLIEKWEKNWAAVVAARRKDESTREKAVLASVAQESIVAARAEVPEREESSRLPPLDIPPRGKLSAIRRLNYIRENKRLLMNQQHGGQ
jgi:hypothetical protein